MVAAAPPWSFTLTTNHMDAAESSLPISPTHPALPWSPQPFGLLPNPATQPSKGASSWLEKLLVHTRLLQLAGLVLLSTPALSYAWTCRTWSASQIFQGTAAPNLTFLFVQLQRELSCWGNLMANLCYSVGSCYFCSFVVGSIFKEAPFFLKWELGNPEACKLPLVCW